jgi:hypothetical protein
MSANETRTHEHTNDADHRVIALDIGELRRIERALEESLIVQRRIRLHVNAKVKIRREQIA